MSPRLLIPRPREWSSAGRRQQLTGHDRAKRGGCNGQSFCRTASISRLILILSPTTTPPPSSGMLNSMPKSARLISVPAENPARVPPMGSGGDAVELQPQVDRAGDAVDGQVAGQLEVATARRPHRGGHE